MIGLAHNPASTAALLLNVKGLTTMGVGLYSHLAERHEHTHEAMAHTHRHPHYPDLHHRHGHAH